MRSGDHAGRGRGQSRFRVEPYLCRELQVHGVTAFAARMRRPQAGAWDAEQLRLIKLQCTNPGVRPN